jgi:hypothetical protein
VQPLPHDILLFTPKEVHSHALGQQPAVVTLPHGFVRPPPPQQPAGWLDDVPIRGRLQVKHRGAWWDAKLIEKRASKSSSRGGAPKYVVAAADGSALPAAPGGERLVSAEELRPNW